MDPISSVILIPHYPPRHLRRHRAHRICQVAHLVEVDADGAKFALALEPDVPPIGISFQHQFVADVDLSVSVCSCESLLACTMILSLVNQKTPY